MKHFINPQVDCVFKALLGAEKNKELLISFLNAIIEPKQPIDTVHILNPFNEQDFSSDKLSVVDVKATDDAGQLFHIEIQIVNSVYLPERMLYYWSKLYGKQIAKGEHYQKLKPVYSIWLLAEDLIPDAQTSHHRYTVYNPSTEHCLTEHLWVHILELNKATSDALITNKDQWLYFFRKAKYWKQLPEQIKLPELGKAMATLEEFSEKDADYYRYLAQEDALHVEATWKHANASLEQKLVQAAEREQQAAEREQQAIAERESLAADKQRLEALLINAGIDPNGEMPQ